MPEQKKITAVDAIRGLREIITEVGPATTRECKYVEYEPGDLYQSDPIAPHCVVGYFLNRNGVDLEGLAALEGESVRGAVGEAFVEDVVKFDESAVEVLWAAQQIQDDGYNWGQALEAAEAVFTSQRAGSRYDTETILEGERNRLAEAITVSTSASTAEELDAGLNTQGWDE
jgi:hypothetical protein